MTELEKFNLMLQGGYNPMGGGITTNQMEDFKTAGLFNQIQDTNNLISSLNIPNNPNPVPNTADEDLLKKQKRANMLIAFGDLLRGKDATAGFTQRQAQFDAERERAERKARQEQRLQQQEEFIKNNPQFEQLIRFNQLFGMDMPKPKNPRIIKGADGYNYYEDGSRVLGDVVKPEPKTKKTKSDFVVDILTKIQNDPTYGTPDNPLTVEDQNTLDIISDTDPMEILKREMAKKMKTGFPNNTNQPITITTQDEFDKLAKGTKYIYNGTEYIKGQ